MPILRRIEHYDLPDVIQRKQQEEDELQQALLMSLMDAGSGAAVLRTPPPPPPTASVASGTATNSTYVAPFVPEKEPRKRGLDVIDDPLGKRNQSTVSPLAGRIPSLPVMRFDGKTFFCNRISFIRSAGNEGCVNLDGMIDPGLRRVIVSAFQLDLGYLRRLAPWPIPVVAVIHYNSQSEQAGKFMLEDQPDVMVVHPPMLERGAMHAKFALLEYEHFMRVVITSANLTEEDWTLIGQVTWVQDFPRVPLRDLTAQLGADAPPFGAALARFLQAMKINPSALRGYDFSAAAVSLVASVPGYYQGTEEKADGVRECLIECFCVCLCAGKDANQYGHLALRSVVSSVTVSSSTPLVAQVSVTFSVFPSLLLSAVVSPLALLSFIALRRRE